MLKIMNQELPELLVQQSYFCHGEYDDWSFAKCLLFGLFVLHKPGTVHYGLNKYIDLSEERS